MKRSHALPAPAALLLLLALVSVRLPAGETQSGARELVVRAQELITIEAMEALSTLITTSGSARREQKLAMISGTFNGIEKRLIRFLEPADIRGTGFLTWDHASGEDDMWIYLPSLGKSRRVAGGEKSKSFMGSEFTYMDMTQFDPDDFVFNLEGKETIDGRECYIVRQEPASPALVREYGFMFRTLAIGTTDGLMYRAVYTDSRGREWKLLEVLDIRPAGTEGGMERFRAWHLRMTNLQNRRISEMKVDAFQLTGDPPEEYFSVRYLER